VEEKTHSKRDSVGATAVWKTPACYEKAWDSEEKKTGLEGEKMGLEREKMGLERKKTRLEREKNGTVEWP